MRSKLKSHPLFSLPPKEVEKFLIIFYIVGIVGFTLPFTNAFFIHLTKWALLLNFVLLIWYHDGQINIRVFLALLAVFLFGFFIEVVGVNTGLIFGEYWYGRGLGIKVLDTPLMIGVNWLMLSYCFASLLETYRLKLPVRLFFASLGMLIYDLVLEQSAASLDLWYWTDSKIPVKNYLAWFFAALLVQLVFYVFRMKFKNPIARTLLLCQLAFFVALAIYNQFV